MAITRLSIVVEDKVNNTGTIIIDEVGHEQCDLSFLGTYPCSECEENVQFQGQFSGIQQFQNVKLNWLPLE